MMNREQKVCGDLIRSRFPVALPSHANMQEDGSGVFMIQGWMWSARMGQTDGVRKGIADGANVNAQHEGCTALFWAVREGHAEVAGVLLAAGAALWSNRGGDLELLHRAAEWGHAGVVTVLLDFGANFAARDFRGRTPLEWAVAGGHAEVAKLLWDRGAAVVATVHGGLRPVREWEVLGGDEGPEVLLHLAAEKGHAGKPSLPSLLSSPEGDPPLSRLTFHPRRHSRSSMLS